MNTWLLPEGINESLPDDAEKLEKLRRQLVDRYATWGYRLVMPPMVEYLESLRAGMGTQLDLQTFKITDQQNGRMMGVRADMTPQIARIDAHRISKGDTKASVNRLCYIGTVLRTRSAQQGGSRSPVQVGAEIFGHSGVESDFEIISLMLDTLHSINVTELVLDIGHVGVVNGVAEYAGLTKNQQQNYFDMLSRKSIPEINVWVIEQGLSDSVGAMLEALPMLIGSNDVIETAKERLKEAGQPVLDALEHLENITQLVSNNFPEIKVNIDLAEMRGYSYHTGIMYTVYLPGRGESIANGGRYDGIGEAFGNSRPAIGFSTDLRTLASMMKHTEIKSDGILAPFTLDKDLDQLVTELRQQGKRVIRQLDESSTAVSEQQGCNRKIEKQGDNWIVVAN
ncbi:ATP phosphoribosyltransferase regulatory subunit [Cocleimonas flava]|uniref:ATP phosphoribosyltransferase regulatory subunit n=1 Tax=Cocleimonas flava TaxID=634765 RepID=A0A4R1EZD8_9GAMM|nr:ATP phosphoribosyltransferase regulatory subunit [Cocleimonas flava]TCJ85289.1 ATP phosphoribosyltransferase regulatory subunit [Cocleimonas flava]